MIEVLNSDGIDQIRYSIYNTLDDTKLSKRTKDRILKQVGFLEQSYRELRDIILDCYYFDRGYDIYICRFCFSAENNHFDGCIVKALQ